MQSFSARNLCPVIEMISRPHSLAPLACSTLTPPTAYSNPTHFSVTPAHHRCPRPQHTVPAHNAPTIPDLPHRSYLRRPPQQERPSDRTSAISEPTPSGRIPPVTPRSRAQTHNHIRKQA
ncbi:hypothetical protein AAFF_G00113150 [Aldrovandia affinis]|uniref:Uncharacterized protein n=1 Tax=Aldrovandia affinis TaxID=143900 RepID=A0AAD7WAE7_9TELE|nr:hypothetical protein AAFF_G00113150 [Aldrovandia affinis]